MITSFEPHSLFKGQNEDYFPYAPKLEIDDAHESTDATQEQIIPCPTTTESQHLSHVETSKDAKQYPAVVATGKK